MNLRTLIPPIATLPIFAICILYVVTCDMWTANHDLTASSPGAGTDLPNIEPPEPVHLTVLLTPDNQLAEITSRPLFSPTRRDFTAASAPSPATPLEEAPSEAPDEAVPLPPPTLSFIGLLNVSGRNAGLLQFENGEEKWLAVGDVTEGWQVVEISSTEIRLKHHMSGDIVAIPMQR